MPTLSLTLLKALIPTEVASPPNLELAELLQWLSRRDHFGDAADALERQLIASIGWPSIVVQLPSGIVTIGDQTTLRQLQDNSQVDLNEVERLSRRLDRRLRQWSSQINETGLRGLRRREHAAAQHSARLARRMLLTPAGNLQAIELKIALLAAKAEGTEPVVLQLHRDATAVRRQLAQLTNITNETSRLRR